MSLLRDLSKCRPRWRHAGVTAVAGGVCSIALGALGATAAEHSACEFAPVASVPPWLFPSDSVSQGSQIVDPQERVGLPGSAVKLTRAELSDRHGAPDWHPLDHAAMPAVVARGRGADVYACGYCHTPTGQGRPENAPLAGLPAAYIEEQVAAFASGARRSAWSRGYAPSELMVGIAQHLFRSDVVAAAEYFSTQRLRSRVRVVETARIHRWRVIGLVYAARSASGEEPLGDRLLEFAPSPERHELRDDRMRYVAYVPIGSIARGRLIAQRGIPGTVNACAMCHGPKLGGLGAAPPLAGRSPTYLLRSLYAFRVGRRSGGSAALMQPIATGLDPGAMIAAVAYAASLPP